MSESVREDLVRRAEALAVNPRPFGVKKLVGPEGLYRVRAGDYRIIYEIRDAVLMIIVLKVAPRDEAYRQ